MKVRNDLIGSKISLKTYNLFTTPQHTQFAESHVKRRAHISSIWLFNNNYINRAGQRCGINFAVELFEVAKHFVCDAKHVCFLIRLNSVSYRVGFIKDIFLSNNRISFLV